MERQKFLENIESKTGKEKLEAILEYSKYLRQVDPEESLAQAKQVLDDELTKTDSELEIWALMYISTSCFYIPDFEKAEYWTNRLRSAGEKFGDSKAIADSYNMKARSAFQHDELSLAHKQLLTALEYYLEADSRAELISCYNALGLIHLSRDEESEARPFLEQALEIAESIGSETAQSIRLNLSKIAYGQGKYEETLEINRKILEYYQEHDLHHMAGTALNNIGLACFGLRRFREGIEALEKANEMHLKSRQWLDLCGNCKAIAKAYIFLGQPFRGYKYLTRAEEITDAHGFKWERVEIYEAYSNYYEALGDYRKANYYQKEKFRQYTKLIQKQNKEKLNELETKYKTRIYQMQNQELSEKNKALDKQIKELNDSQELLQKTYWKLQKEFEQLATAINRQDDLLSAQSRMNVMGEMLSAIAHQWKQPLNVIWVLAQGIEDAWEFNELNDEMLTNQVKMIGEQVTYMSETINDFRDFFRQDRIDNFNVEEVIEKSLKLVIYLINKSKIKLEKELSGDCQLSGNPNELSQVLINVINNARQAIEEQAPAEPLIRISLTCDEAEIKIIIYNSGQAVPESDLERIFEPYFSSKGNSGTGLGLHICRQIIENKYNGSIRAVNKKGGVEFELKLPRQKTTFKKDMV